MRDNVIMAIGLPTGGMVPDFGLIEMENRVAKFPVEFYRFWLQGFNMPRISSFSESSKPVIKQLLDDGFFIECDESDGNSVFNAIVNLTMYRQGIQKEVTDEGAIFMIGDSKIEIPKNDIFLHVWQSCTGETASLIYQKNFEGFMPREYFGIGVCYLYSQGLLFLSRIT